MLNLLGALVIIFGFLSPFIVRLPVGSTILPTIFFCIGFLLLLKPNRKFINESVWLKWGRIGVLVNIIGFFIFLLITLIVSNTSFSDKSIGSILLSGTRWIFMPITALSESFFPYYEKIMISDGNVGMKINYLRWTFISFSNVLLYILLAAFIGKLFFTKRERYR